jgi:DNA-directed RNA polymerase specialized sigma24 family protein
LVPHRVTGEAPVSKVLKALPWAKKRALPPSWKPSPQDLFRHIDVIRRAVQRAGIRPGDVDDTAADIIGIAWRQLPTFKGYTTDPKGSFRAWLAAISWRIARDRRVREKHELAVAFAHFDQDGLLYPSPHEQVMARFDLRRLGCLTLRYRQIAVFLAIYGSLTDAAHAAGIPIGTASTRARALRRRLIRGS